VPDGTQIFLTRPPQYSFPQGTAFCRVIGTSGKVSEPDRLIYYDTYPIIQSYPSIGLLLMQSSLLISRLPVSSATVFKFDQGNVYLGGKTFSLGTDDSIDVTFANGSYGRLDAYFPSRRVVLQGKPLSVRINSQEILPRLIDDFPDYLRGGMWILITTLASTLGLRWKKFLPAQE
jgi:hypothetical protein